MEGPAEPPATAKGAAGLPIFAPAATYLVAAGAVIELSKNVGMYFVEAPALFKVTEALSIDLPGGSMNEDDAHRACKPCAGTCALKRSHDKEGNLNIMLKSTGE